MLLKIFCDYDKESAQLEVIEADRPIMVGEIAVRKAPRNSRTATPSASILGQVLRCNFSERIIEEERNIIRTLELSDVTHRFGKHESGSMEFPSPSRAAKSSA